MVKELHLAKLKKELLIAKETIAELHQENEKLEMMLIRVEDVNNSLILNLIGTGRKK